MGSQHHHHLRIGETSFKSESAAAPSSSSCPGHINSISYAMLQGMNHRMANTTTTTTIPALYMYQNQGGSSLFDFGELERAIVLNHSGGGGHHLHDDIKSQMILCTVAAAAALYTTAEGGEEEGRPATATTLEMFPSWPIKFQQQHHHNTRLQQQEQESWNAGGGRRESTSDDDDSGSGSAVNTVSIETTTHFRGGDQPETPPISISSIRTINQIINGNNISQNHQQQQQSNSHQEEVMMMTGHIPKTGTGSVSQNHRQHQSGPVQQRAGSGSTRSSEKPVDAKTLRRLAQNREAAKKSRLRKKAYVQQLESSRIKLAQLEQDLQRARAQGLFAGGAPTNISSGAAIFDMEYARWLDDDHRHMTELRTGLQAHLSDADLRLLVDGCINHHDEIFRLKGAAAKSDVFHLITGMWTTPAERCFLWMGGFRPSELIKMLRAQLDPLTEHQMMGIHSLQESSQQAEEALTQGLEQLQQSLVDTIAGTTVMDGMQQMAVALGKLSSLEGFVRQADNLRQQTLHQLCRILTVRQAARCFLMIGEYYGRLRALSSLWSSRPKESIMGDAANTQATFEWQMMQQHQTTQTHFPAF